MATPDKNSPALALDLSASERRRTPARSVFLQRLYADDSMVQSCLYGLLNDTDLALLSLVCKFLLRSVVDFYNLQAGVEAPCAEASEATVRSTWREGRLIDQIRKRRVRVSDCLVSLELQRFYALSIQIFLTRVEMDHPLTYLRMFNCDKGQRLCAEAVQTEDLLQLRSIIWSVATGPLIDDHGRVIDRAGHFFKPSRHYPSEKVIYRFYHQDINTTDDVDRFMLFLRPEYIHKLFPRDTGDVFSEFKYKSSQYNYFGWYMEWYSEKCQHRVQAVKEFAWAKKDQMGYRRSVCDLLYRGDVRDLVELGEHITVESYELARKDNPYIF
ncbi:hypothetical protein CYMTET_5613 [Cymbomonas tetramitiformis]|uniref:Uncharacterized protein n=1 Tax=Cymbomonas tetramitiformis TaxID=36881 RepID=A0AAE0GZ60_9CHLO|nr:hypothetical protein CYMTET_5613 [Cymbomonas tetramitiformis]